MNKQVNFKVNFSLKGFTSIQIGIYLLIASYFIESMLTGFLIDDNTFGMMSPEIIEYLMLFIAIFTFLFSSFALYFKGKRRAKKQQYKLWNTKTKNTFFVYLISFIILFGLLVFLMNAGYVDMITPFFLIIYGVILYLLKDKQHTKILVISGVCFLLAVICFLIPTYWYSSLFILGIAHITYGIMVKN